MVVAPREKDNRRVLATAIAAGSGWGMDDEIEGNGQMLVEEEIGERVDWLNEAG